MKNKIKPKDFVFMSQRQRTSPFPNYMSMESMCKEMKQYTGQKLDEMLCIWQGNLLFGFPHKLSYEQSGKNLTKKIFKNPFFPASLVSKQKKYGKELIDFTKDANKIINNKTSNKKLAQLFQRYEKKYKPVYATYGWIWLTEDFFAAELLKIVEKKIGDKKMAVDILNVLTKEPSAMVAMIERKALLELALKINNQKGWKTNKKVEKLIQNHVKKYFWLTRDYEDPVITFKDVISRLAELFEKDFQKEYHKLINSLKQNEILRKKYFRDLNFSPQEKRLFFAMCDISYLKELRKTYVSQSLYYFDRVLEEIAKRLFLSIKQVRFSKTSELKQLFKEFCEVDKNKKEFFGLPVSPGIAKGPAKIVMNPDECGKVKKGDIIVTVQVVPSFSTAIIKSAGLICDGGHGITSHPATLAREAGIPCVIQTRFAREVIKDGDIVEVDGYKGIARIIK